MLNHLILLEVEPCLRRFQGPAQFPEFCLDSWPSSGHLRGQNITPTRLWARTHLLGLSDLLSGCGHRREREHEPRKEFLTMYIFPLQLQEDTVSCLHPAQPEMTSVSLSPHLPSSHLGALPPLHLPYLAYLYSRGH